MTITSELADRDGAPSAPADVVMDSVAGDWSDFGCEVNAITPAELFARYEQTRFLYPAKRARLAPYWHLVLENWQRARRAGELLNWVATYRDPAGGWASVSSWRSTGSGWQSQHLVSTGTLVGGRAVLLAAQAVVIRDGRTTSHQDWFSPDNRFSAQAFGGMVSRIGPESAAVIPGEYVMVPMPQARSMGQPYRGTLEELDGGRCAELVDLVCRTRGEVYLRSEALAGDDLRLEDTDRLYRLVGLRRYRRIWVCADPAGRLQAAAIAYRGPLGLNFSFLENRCDLLVDPDLGGETAHRAATQVLAAAATGYDDFELGAIPVVADAATAHRLVAAGAEPVRAYAQAIWLADAYPQWYRHIDELYESRLRGRIAHPRRPA